MNSLIIPVGGLSTRFPNMRPKWLLTHPNGNFMFIEAVKGINLGYFDNVYLICIKSVLEKYKCKEGIIEQVKGLKKIRKFKIIILDKQTRNQPETIYKGIKQEGITGSVCIKDCDNFFEFSATNKNFIAYCDLDDLSSVNASNKSYLLKNQSNLVTNIVEKQVISKHFCSGCYGFEDAETFIKYFEMLKSEDHLYVSHVIYKMILDEYKFSAIKCFNYIDWGTLNEWSDYTRGFSTIFIDIDGVIVKNSAEYFEPKWGQSEGLENNIECINKLFESGKTQVILVTSRKRSSKKITLKQLEKIGLKYHMIYFGLLHAKRVLVNDYSPTNPFRSCDALNIKRDTEELSHLLPALTSSTWLK